MMIPNARISFPNFFEKNWIDAKTPKNTKKPILDCALPDFSRDTEHRSESKHVSALLDLEPTAFRTLFHTAWTLFIPQLPSIKCGHSCSVLQFGAALSRQGEVDTESLLWRTHDLLQQT
jgi:hypothetical protein